MRNVHSKALRPMMDSFDGGDPWGSAMAMAFAVAEVSNAIGYEEPQERMEYRRSPVAARATLDELASEDCEDYEARELAIAFIAGEFTVADLNWASRVLHRYLGILDKAGKSY